MKNTIIELYGKYKNDGVSEVAAQLTYYLILSIFPFIITLLQIIKFTPLGDLNVVEGLLVNLPLETQEVLTGIIKDVLSSSGTTLLSVGIIGAIWSASNGLMSLIKAVNRAYDLSESRPYWKLKLLSVVMTLALIVVILLSLTINVFETLLFTNYIVGYFPNSELIFSLVQGAIVILSIILILTLLYKFSPSIKEEVNITFKQSFPGGVFAAFGILVSSKLFSLYVDNFGNYSKVYGSIGGIIVLLIWLYLTSIIIVMGAELNSIFMNRKKDKENALNSELNEDKDVDRNTEPVQEETKQETEKKNPSILENEIYYMNTKKTSKDRVTINHGKGDL